MVGYHFQLGSGKGLFNTHSLVTIVGEGKEHQLCKNDLFKINLEVVYLHENMVSKNNYEK